MTVNPVGLQRWIDSSNIWQGTGGM